MLHAPEQRQQGVDRQVLVATGLQENSEWRQEHRADQARSLVPVEVRCARRGAALVALEPVVGVVHCVAHRAALETETASGNRSLPSAIRRLGSDR
ncbi:hypothetical protein ON010_g12510 [Phytophthora cinnamomi]|nr:hypothetical protein ON010_g12510 [Phytophthora cinnamomi]